LLDTLGETGDFCLVERDRDFIVASELDAFDATA